MRDETLGLALAELPVPEHRPGFFAELEAALERARPRPRRRWRLRVGALATAAVAALAVALVVTLREPAPADAAGIARASERALADLRTIIARATYRAVDSATGAMETSRFSLALGAGGDVRVTRLEPTYGDLAYDAASGTAATSETSASLGTGRFYAERRGVARVSDEPLPDAVVGRELGAAVRTLAASGDPQVTETELDGRPVWRLEADVRPNTIFADIDHLSVLVDQATDLPVRVVATLAGAVRSDLRLKLDSVNESLPEALFALDFPPGAEVQRLDSGFRRVPLADVEARVGYAPLVPAALPAGFELREVAVAEAAEPTAGGTNPPSRKVVSLAYRRGLEQVVVTTRLRGTGTWRDPFAVAGVEQRERPTPIRGGALRGATARVVVDPRSLPHLWAQTDRLVVTVAGDLDADELGAAAASLRERAP